MPAEAQLAAFLSVTFLLALTPGATTAVVVRNALAGGWQAGLIAAAGAAAGNLTQATAAGLGLAVLIHDSPVLGLVLRIAGGAYLSWLGLQSVRRALANDAGRRFEKAGAHLAGSAFRQGLVTNLLNPSIATYYLVVLPSFLPAGARPRDFAALAAMHIGIAFVCHTGWATAFDRLKTLFARPAFSRGLEGATGVALLALAIRTLLGR